MTKQYAFLRLFLIGWLCLLSQWGYAATNGGDVAEDTKKPVHEGDPALPTPGLPNVGLAHRTISLKTLTSLDRVLMNSLPAEAKQELLSRAMELAADDVPDVLSADARGAKKIFDEMEKSGGIVIGDFSSDSFKELPFFVKVTKAGTAANGSANPNESTDLLLGINKVTFFPGYVEMSAFVRAYIKGREVFFGIDKLKYVQGSGFAGTAKLVLLGSYNFNLGSSMTLRLNGGAINQTGAMSDQTSLEFDCGKFKQISLSATLSLKSSTFVRINENTGAVLAGQPVSTTIKTQIQDFQNFVFSINLPAFSIAKFANKVGFVVQEATLDFSDNMSMADMKTALVNYDNTYENVAEFNAWRGVYIKTLKVLLPKEIAAAKKPANGAAAATPSNTDPLRAFGTKDLFIDGTGLTFSLFAYNMIALNEGAAGGWPLSLDSLNLDIKRNEFQRLSMAGRIKIPIASKKGQPASTSTNPKDVPEILTYRGLIDPTQDEYSLTIGISNLKPLNMFGGQATLLPNSYVELKVAQGTFKPKAVLSGTWAFGVNLSGDVSAGAGSGTAKDVGFKQINFQNLILQTEKPYISVTSFGYKDETNSLGGFPLQIRRIQASFAENGTGQPTFILGMGLDLTLQSKSFAAKVDGDITWTKTTVNGEESWDLSRVDLNKFNIDADFSAFKIKGKLEFMRQDPTFGNGFRGTLNINVGAAMKSTVTLDVKSIFGRVDNYYYFYLDAMATLPVGIRVGPMELYGLGGGFAINMERKPNKTSDFSMTGMAYEPKKNNYGVMFALAFRSSFDAGKTLEGTGGFMMEMSGSYGLTRIGLFVSSKIGNLGASGGANLASTYKTLPISTAGSMTQKSGSIPRPAQSSAILTANLGIDYNFSTNELIVAGTAYFSTSDGSLRGAYANDRVGNVDMYFSARSWYVYVGKPQTPLSVSFKKGSFTGSATAYLVTGSSMPYPFQNGGAGLGFAYDLRGGTGLMRGSIFYAELNFFMGLQFLLQKNVYCANVRQTKDWYATMYAYFGASGRAGVRVGGSDYDIAQASVSAYLNAGGMEPFYINGSLSFYARVLCSNLTFWYPNTRCRWGGWHNTVLRCRTTWESYDTEVCLFKGGGSINISLGTKCN